MAENTKKEAMLLDGVFASQALDSSGEVLDIQGADITDFLEGKAFANWEHLQKDNDKHPPGSEIVGKVIYAKKIYKESDCVTDRQLHFWREVEEPMIYGIVRMFDSQEGHQSAQHISAIIRDSVQHNEPLTIGFSIEGSTLKRSGAKLEKTVCKAVAITVRPCNKTAAMGILKDDTLGVDLTEEPVRKEEQLQFTPLHTKIGSHESDYGPEMLKALAAGSYDVAPSSATQGAALQIEGLDKKAARKQFKSKFLGALRDWPGDVPLKKFMKAKMPEVSDDFLDHFQEIVDNKGLSLKKTEDLLPINLDAFKFQFQELEVDLKKAHHPHLDPFNPEKHLFYIVGTYAHGEGQSEKFLGKLFKLGDEYHVLEDHGLPEDGDMSNLQLYPHDEFQKWFQKRHEPQQQEPSHELVSLIHEIADPSKEIPIYMAFHLDLPEGKTSTLLTTPQAVYLDGQLLDEQEIARVMDNVKAGKVQLRHTVQEEPLGKMEDSLKNSLNAIREAVKSGHLKPEVLKGVTSKIFTSTMVPSMGNKQAYQDFLSRPRGGYHVHVDLNDFGHFNKHPFNYTIGDQAIKDAGGAMRRALDETAGRSKSKSYHISGDEFVAHLPTKEHAVAFSKAFAKHLSAIPKIGGTHGLSASIGFGPSMQHAEKALATVKHQKKLGAHPIGQSPTYFQGHDDAAGTAV